MFPELPENENPELSVENQGVEAGKEENTENPLKEDNVVEQEVTTESPVEQSESPISTESESEITDADTSTEDITAAEEPAVENPPPGEESPTESASEDVVTSDEPKEEPSEEKTPTAEDSESKSEPSRELVLPNVDDDRSKALYGMLGDILGDESKGTQLLTDVTPDELIFLMGKFYNDSEIRSNIPRVGLVKRSFDALRASDPLERNVVDDFREILAAFNRKRAEHQKKEDAAKSVNSSKKQALLADLQQIVEADDPHKINEVRGIQDQWKQVGHVLKKDIEPLYKQYRFLLDKFYQQRAMHFELLDYDRKINLTEKEKLIKDAEKLIPPEEDRKNIDAWRERMDMLQELQQQWKTIGFVPREDLERINNEYRAAIDRFFDVRQGFIEIQDQFRAENETKKKEILTKMTPFQDYVAEKPRAWNDATRELRELQEAWKEIGQAPQQSNSELWGRYREICNKFFSNKSDFFKKLDERRAVNLQKKRELVEKVEELKGTSNWEQTAKELKQLQREWKEIGPVPERHSNKLWNRFREACDSFFEARRTHYNSLHEDENINLEAKKALIEEAKKVDVGALGSPEAVIAKAKELQAKWKEIGKVPFKEKDIVWDHFRSAIDKVFDQLSMKREEIRDLKLRSSVPTGGDARSRDIKGKISKFRRKIAQSQEKVDQYSINIQYISKGKSGDTLRNQIQGEIDKEIRMIGDWKKNIKSLNDLLKNPPKEVETPAPEADKTADAPSAEVSEEKKTETTEEGSSETPEPEAEKTAEEPNEEKTETAEEATSESEAESTPEENAPEAEAESSDSSEEETSKE